MFKRESTFEGIRKKLVGMQQEILREAKTNIAQSLVQENKYNGASDDGDWADIAFREAMETAKFSRHQARLKAIEEALRSIDEGTYGVCADCGEKIPPGRLNALPFALRCVECQETYEKQKLEHEGPWPHLPGSREEERD